MRVTANLVLSADVGPCPGNGLVIAADSITVDLGGHRVFGTTNAGEGAGVLAVNRRGVVVMHGTIEGFDAGVLLDGGGGNTVAQLVVRDNVGPLDVPAVGDGVLLHDSSGNTVRANVLDGNGPLDNIGLLGASDGNRIEGNVSLGSAVADRRGGRATQEDDGIRLEPDAGGGPGPRANVVIANTVRGAGLDGIAVFDSTDGNQIVSNLVDANGARGIPADRTGDGIHLFGGAARTTVNANRVSASARDGIRIDLTNPPQPSRPDVAADVHNVVSANTVSGSGTAAGFDAGVDLSDGNRRCGTDSWTANAHATQDDPGAACLN